jgi:hypothetical protein
MARDAFFIAQMAFIAQRALNECRLKAGQVGIATEGRLNSISSTCASRIPSGQ